MRLRRRKKNQNLNEKDQKKKTEDVSRRWIHGWKGKALMQVMGPSSSSLSSTPSPSPSEISSDTSLRMGLSQHLKIFGC